MTARLHKKAVVREVEILEEAEDEDTLLDDGDTPAAALENVEDFRDFDTS